MRDLFNSNTYRFGADCGNIRRKSIKILAFDINRLTTMEPLTKFDQKIPLYLRIQILNSRNSRNKSKVPSSLV